MVAHVSIHDEDEVARYKLEPVDVCCPEAEFAFSLQQLQLVCAALSAVEYANELFCNLASSVGAVVFDDDNLVIEAPASTMDREK